MSTTHNDPSETAQDSIWTHIDQGHGVEFGAYADAVRLNSPIASTERGRDIEMQALFTLYLAVSGGDGTEAVQSRLNTRRKFLGQWSDDSTPFTDDEIREARSQLATIGLISSG